MNLLAKHLLAPIVGRYRILDVTAKRRPKLSAILKETAIAHHLKEDDILCGSRNRRIVYPRQEVMYRAASETLLNLVQIGKALGGRDQSTIHHGIRQHAKRNGLPLPRGMRPVGTCQVDSEEVGTTVA